MNFVSAIQTKKLDASESFGRKLEASRSSLLKEKEDLGMVISFMVLSKAWTFFVICFILLCSEMQQLTDVLLEMESERSMWKAKEKTYFEANQQLNICTDENSRLSEDLNKVPLIVFCMFQFLLCVQFTPDLIHYQSSRLTVIYVDIF